MSKSKGNYIGISESPDSMFGKLMSISDTLMWRYFELLSFRSLEDIAALRQEIEGGRNPRDAKVMLAQEIIARFHSAKAADDALATFEARFRDGAIPEDMPEVSIGGAPVGILKPVSYTHLDGYKRQDPARRADQRGQPLSRTCMTHPQGGPRISMPGRFFFRRHPI